MRRWIWFAAAALMWIGCADWMVGDDPEPDPETVFEAFWDGYDRYYAHFELKDIDWDGVYAEYRPQVGPETSEEELFAIFRDMIRLMQDGHVYVVSDERRALSNTEIRAQRAHFDRDIVHQRYLGATVAGDPQDRITWGRIDDQIGYLRLSTLSGSQGVGDETRGWITEVETAVDELSDTGAMIVDLRNNGGGRAYNAKYVAGHFADERTRFLMTRSRSGPEHDDFSEPRSWYVEPLSGPGYHKPVVVLTNRRTFSAAEWTTLALRQFDHVTHMGTHTGGGLAMFLPRQLPNGWMYTVSVQDTRCPEGRSFERVGVPPQVYLENGDEAADDGRDAMIDAAVEYLDGRSTQNASSLD